MNNSFVKEENEAIETGNVTIQNEPPDRKMKIFMNKFDEECEQINNESEDDDEYNYKEIILKALETLDTQDNIPGAFACGGILPKHKLQLTVKGVGNISLPLSVEQGKVLKTISRAVLYTKGSKTLVNNTVRDAWQVGAENVEVNVEFDKLVKDKVSEIIPHLLGNTCSEEQQQSILESLNVELYKLVYYEKGGHSVSHHDSPNAPEIFATLVIQLPAGHKGGALVIKHNGDTEVYSHGNGSRNSFFFTAFLADCERSLTKITDGFCLVLIYNIIRKNPHLTMQNNNISYSKNEKFVTLLKNAIKIWLSNINSPDFLAMELKFLYTNSNVSFQNLKGNDQKIADALCSFTGIDVCLATVTKRVIYHGYCDVGRGGPNYESFTVTHDETESITLSNWIGVNNDKKNYADQDLTEEEMIGDIENIMKENYNLHKGDVDYIFEYEGFIQEYTYKKTAIVICSKSLEFFLDCKKDLNSVIMTCKNEKEQEKAWEMFCKIMDYIQRHEEAEEQLSENENVDHIIDLLRSFEKKIELANLFFKALLDIGTPNKKMAIAIANLISELSWEPIKANVLAMVENSVTKTEGITLFVSSMLSLGLQEQPINVVEVVTSIAKKRFCESEIAQWLNFLSHNGLINKLSWESLGNHVLKLVKICTVTHKLGIAQLVKSMLIHELQEQTVKVVEVVTSIAKKKFCVNEIAQWLNFLSHNGLLNKLSWESLGNNILKLVKICTVSHTQGIAQLVKSMLMHELQEPTVKVVEVGTSEIISQKGSLSSNIFACWLSLLASNNILGSQYNNFLPQILDFNGNIMIEIIAEMHTSLLPKITDQNKIIECFQNIIRHLQDIGWENFSPTSVTLVIPVLVFVDKNKLLGNLVKVIIQLENSCDFLDPILELPIILRERDNPSVQLMVQTRLQQLEKFQQPVFTWAQPNATLDVNRPIDRSYFPYYKTELGSGPSLNDVQEFLRGDTQSKTFGQFISIVDARLFGEKYFPRKGGLMSYSATHETFGVGKEAKCKIMKTREVFDEETKWYTIFYKKAQVLRRNYCEPKKTVAMKRALE